jgi:hypothetical protein
MVAIARHAPERSFALEHGSALLRAERDLGRVRRADQFDPNPGLEREARQQVIKQAALHEGSRHGQPKTLVIGARLRHAQHEAKHCNQDPEAACQMSEHSTHTQG